METIIRPLRVGTVFLITLARFPLMALGLLALLAGLPAPPLMALGSLGLVAVFAVIVRPAPRPSAWR